ncbi:MAG: arsenate reductase family protein [Brevundimonas sp.]|nr:arsenate reductase family protein [Brevundimonas sp.]
MSPACAGSTGWTRSRWRRRADALAEIVLYHNPRCSTSRQALELLRERGVEPRVVEYLKTGWDRATLERLARGAGGATALLRAKEPGAADLKGATDAALIAAMMADPILVERPVAESDRGVRVGRPPERVLEIL